jgi:hypothetical protein
VINIVYGLTSAKFNNPFRDNRNKDNIVAKRGALFMIDLKRMLHDRVRRRPHQDGLGEDPERHQRSFGGDEFGKQYGYDFEHEATYDALCLVNDAVYIARQGHGKDAKWTAVGAQFQHPYVYKTLFTKAKTSVQRPGETKQVTKGVIYIDFDGREKPTREQMQFVGKIGSFIPVKPSPVWAARSTESARKTSCTPWRAPRDICGWKPRWPSTSGRRSRRSSTGGTTRARRGRNERDRLLRSRRPVHQWLTSRAFRLFGRSRHGINRKAVGTRCWRFSHNSAGDVRGAGVQDRFHGRLPRRTAKAISCGALTRCCSMSKKKKTVPLVVYTDGRRNEIGTAEIEVWPGEVRVSGTLTT